ncbi:hypothetical protein [Chloroflexus sp.]|uniref:hypothetical protein n=1 Tax=Chloroflexus sp. TaxID=1904827 RepID=UPI002ACD4846|nr:hypothetical protein [Chloroflexus sp.]
MPTYASRLEWKINSSPFRNWLIWRQLALVFGIPLVFLGALLMMISEPDSRAWHSGRYSVGFVADSVVDL